MATIKTLQIIFVHYVIQVVKLALRVLPLIVLLVIYLDISKNQHLLVKHLAFKTNIKMILQFLVSNVIILAQHVQVQITINVKLAVDHFS